MDWIRHQQKLFRILEWVTLGIVLALAVSSFYAALHPTMEKNVILSSTLHRFFLGLFMSALSPMQIPFWFGWSMVLFTKKILLPLNSHYNIYIAGIGLGTLLGNCVFIFGGRLIAHRFNANQHLVNWIVGGIFAITALVQLWKMFTKKSVQDRLEHPEDETKAFENQVEEMNKEERNQAF
jgi:putative Ca2+/H+ antiporter (TMEM165/GDT1 family)